MKDGVLRRTLDRGRKKSVRGLSMLGLGRIRALHRLSESVQDALKSDFVEVQGHKMFLDRRDSLGLSFNPVYEPAETAIIRREVQAGMVVLDIGANIGYYTLMFARLAGRGGKVYAYEPEPTNFEILSKNVEINNYKDNVVLSRAAISNNDNVLQRLYLSEKNLGDHRIYGSGPCIEVQTTTIDSQNLEKVDFIKMDIQGAEGLALEGMKKLIERQDHLVVLMEFYPERLKAAGTAPENVLKIIKEAGFFTYNVNEKSAELEPVYDMSEHGESGKFIRDYGYTNLLLAKGKN